MALSLKKQPSTKNKLVLFQKYEINLSYPSKNYYYDSEVVHINIK